MGQSPGAEGEMDLMPECGSYPSCEIVKSRPFSCNHTKGQSEFQRSGNYAGKVIEEQHVFSRV